MPYALRGGRLLSGAVGVGLACVVVLASVGAARAEAPTAEDCLACHQDPGLQRPAPGPGRPASVSVDQAALQGSAHAALACVACHRGATAPHEERLPRVRCDGCHDRAKTVLSAGVHGTVKAPPGARAPTCTGCHGTHAVRRAALLGTALCSTCHLGQVAAYQESIHGRSRARGASEAATCGSCHGETHALRAVKDRGSPTYHLNLPRTCARCHADPELARRYRIPVGDVYKLYLDSIHGRALTRSGLLVAANCSDCHGTHDIRPRTEAASRVFRTNVPGTCGGCHAGILTEYRDSVHGRAVDRGHETAPVCIDCHTAHEIRRVEGAPWQLDVIRECGTCHEESLRTYRDTFHGKVTALGQARVAKCADCHGAHTIQPASHPESAVSPRHVVATCARCHPGATPAFAQFHPHADPRQKARFPQLYYSWVFMTALLVGVFGFFGLHTLLWLPRSFVERRRRRRGPSAEGPPPAAPGPPPEEPGGGEVTP